jgi:reactive intermediate/imine deaminase
MQEISTNAAPPSAGPYSQGIHSGGFVYLAGQGPFGVDGQRVGESFEEQVRQTFGNLAAVAAAAGTDLSHAVRIGVYLNTLDDFAEFNRLAAEYLSTPYPARTTIQADLVGFDVEIDAVVEVDGAAPGRD